LVISFTAAVASKKHGAWDSCAGFESQEKVLGVTMFSTPTIRALQTVLRLLQLRKGLPSSLRVV
jgi:hypothetical protein